MNTPTHAAIERKLKREIASRKQAELLLEEKSLELFRTNQKLEVALKQLETKSEGQIRRLQFQEQIDTILIHFGGMFLRKSLDDILISDLIQHLTNDGIGIVEYSKITLDANILPEVTRGVYGHAELITSPLEGKKSQLHWNGHLLYVPIKVENKVIGSLNIQIHDNEEDNSYIESQMSLVVELLSNAIIRQLNVLRAIEARQRAEASERSTRDFLAMINHELRTPLNGLLGSAELLRDTQLDEHQQALCHNLGQSGEFLRVIINDLLDYSKINAGMMELIPSAFKWQDLHYTLNSIFLNRALEKQIKFSIHADQSVPERFFGDLERITQVLVNLIGNAVKFTESGGVTVGVCWAEHQLMVSVKDTGIGISEKAQEKLFQPFTQADRSSSRKYEGTGLGLAICKQLVELMKGSITLQSTLGSGTEFKVTLPLQLMEVDKESDQSEITAMPLADYSRLKVLVVDDIKMNQIVITKMLAKLDVKPQIVDNGLLAVNAATESEFDIIFMDCRMPVMDGFTATETLRGQGYKNPILAVTAGTTLEERDKCMEVGMNDILTKPYTANDLKQILSKWI
ncbi:hybrid sensor histidine kinase/response regulator [Vibrio sp. 10N.286.49.B3]|uniref:ATP-binding protein n=1 Tax=Vibrio sp. 10N.286.49.B3 TaxID=1880855 RepID=UPI000C84902B|nr:ATP-binding protein [Vibrio sp. 10N.286.49.B3]PMH46575.1 hybrid sensor histidine kinase/response regulator [Vibrio sp. 10N.286.49.B3]